MQNSSILLSNNPSFEEMKLFVQKLLYQYSKTHKYSTVLESILLQILMRQLLGYTVEISHVYSHLLDEEYGLEGHMSIEEHTRKMNKMEEKYGNNTRAFLKGNMHADQQLNQELTDALYSKINFKTTTLPSSSYKMKQQEIT
jgi:hypothetical protein